MSPTTTLPIHGSYDVATVLVCNCARCGWQWQPRRNPEPRKCPGCGTRFWDKPRPNPAGRPAKRRVEGDHPMVAGG